ncbi:hypothetical protein EMPS_01274 [Entomortierella parvispora]|uniref:Uncharacterized protein n=1 Tax=Entomortierella parvispora TaxID=205924 RepID=A0A9P3H2J0_9FUNG|nr:hypothetical protein EMPS_01274 [Entomortierella parvispora]
METGYFNSRPPRPDPPQRPSSTPTTPAPVTSPLHTEATPIPIVASTTPLPQSEHPLSFASSSPSYPVSSYSASPPHPSSVGSDILFQPSLSPAPLTVPLLPIPEQALHPTEIPETEDALSFSSNAPSSSMPISDPIPASREGPQTVSFAPDPPHPGPSLPAQPPLVAINTNASELALKNAVAGGLMSSSTSVPPATHVYKMLNSAPSSSISSPLRTHNNNISNSGGSGGHHGPPRRSSMKRSSISTASGRSGHSSTAKGVSALSAIVAAEKAHNTAIVAAATSSHKPKRPDMRSYHYSQYSFGNLGMIYPPSRSVSYAGSSTTGRSLSDLAAQSVASTGGDGAVQNRGESHHESQQSQQPQQQQSPQQQDLPGLRKSLSVGKTGKRGFATRLRKLRQRRGSASHGVTSGESDAESPSIGYTQKSSSFGKPSRTGQVDPSLPPPPPMRVNSGPSKDTSVVSPTYAIPYGFGNMGVAPLTIVTKSVPKNNSAPPSSEGGLVLPPATGSSDLKESSSTARFKQMIKRNVGLSSAAPSPTASTTTLTPGGYLGSPSPTIRPSTSWNGSNDFLPLDDQYFPPINSRVSRLAGTGRRARLARKLIPGYGLPSDGEDNDSTVGPLLTMRVHQHRHQSFLPHLHTHRRKSRDHDQSGGEIGGQLPQPPVITVPSSPRESGERDYIAPGVSKALKEARQANQEANVLLAEVRPLPQSFVEAYTAMQAPSKKKTPVTRQVSTQRSATPLPSQQQQLQQQQFLQQQQKAGVSLNAAASLGQGGNISILPIMTTPLLRTQRIVTTTNMASGTASARNTPPPPPPPRIIDPLGTKSFLFKSYQNSRFQGHYIFRVLGDKVQYCKLPVGVEQACCQYFREADVTYRSIEFKSKEWREQKRIAMEKREKEFREAQASRLWITPLDIRPRPRLSQTSHSDPLQQQAKTRLREDGGALDVKGSGLLTKSADMMGGDDEITLENTLHNASVDVATLSSQEDEKDDSSFPLRGYGYERSNSDPTGILSDELRRDLEAASGVAISSATSIHGDDDDPALAFEQSSNQPRLSFSSLTSKTADESALILFQHEEERWARFKEQQQLEQIQRSFDHAYWLEIEQQNCKAAKEAYYGLELYLHELLRIAQVEYETFDLLTEVSIRNENKDSSLLTVVNGDKTNVMSLESPSLRQKYEFLNWVSICLMDHGEIFEPDPTQTVSIKKQRDRLDGHPNSASEKPNYDRGIVVKKGEFGAQGSGDSNLNFLLGASPLDKGTDDSLLDLSTVRLALMQAEIQSKREHVAVQMKGIEDALDQLEKLDDSARRLLVTLQRAIEGQEVQSALRPAPSTGLTLAETVEQKIKDVNDRIIVCTRIMCAARLNLNRLKYEIELEQRSMRLFRQYKIAIAVISVLLLALGYFLYHQRVEQRLQEKLLYIQQQHQIRQQQFHSFLGTVDPKTGRKESISPKSPLQVILLGGPDAADLPPPETTSPFFDHPVQNPFGFLEKFHGGCKDCKKDKKKRAGNTKAKKRWPFFSLKEPVDLDKAQWDELGMCPAQKSKHGNKA